MLAPLTASQGAVEALGATWSRRGTIGQVRCGVSMAGLERFGLQAASLEPPQPRIR
jgi:hypothetical protein